MNRTIKILHDYGARNPRNEWDGQIPLYTDGGRYFGKNEYGIDVIDFLQKKLNTKNMYKVALELGYSKEDVQEQRCYGRKTIDVVSDYISEIDTIEEMTSVLDVYGVKYHNWTSRGYSQWDAIDCLFIATNEWIAENGIDTEKLADEFKTYKKIFDAYTRGHVYGVQIYKTIKLYDENGKYVKDDEEIIESCYGFYDDESMLEYAKEYGITENQFEEAKFRILI